MPPGAIVKEEDVPAAAAVKEEGAVPPMPPDAFVVVGRIVGVDARASYDDPPSEGNGGGVRPARDAFERETVGR